MRLGGANHHYSVIRNSVKYMYVDCGKADRLVKFIDRQIHCTIGLENYMHPRILSDCIHRSKFIK